MASSNMNNNAIAKTLRAAADSLDGEPTLRAVLEGLLERTGKVEDLLAVLSEIYADKRGTGKYVTMDDQMSQTEELLIEASKAIEDVWE